MKTVLCPMCDCKIDISGMNPDSPAEFRCPDCKTVLHAEMKCVAEGFSLPMEEKDFIRTACPHCGQHYAVDIYLKIRFVHCQNCHQEFALPRNHGKPAIMMDSSMFGNYNQTQKLTPPSPVPPIPVHTIGKAVDSAEKSENGEKPLPV